MWNNQKQQSRFSYDYEAYRKKGLTNRGDIKTVRNGNLVITLWQDTKVVSMASTNCQPDDIVRQKWDKN